MTAFKVQKHPLGQVPGIWPQTGGAVVVVVVVGAGVVVVVVVVGATVVVVGATVVVVVGGIVVVVGAAVVVVVVVVVVGTAQPDGPATNPGGQVGVPLHAPGATQRVLPLP